MSELGKSVRAAFDKAEPVDLDAGPEAPVPPEAIEPDLPPEAEAAGFPLNDYGNGCRLVHYYGRDILFVPRLSWLRFDGKRWASDEDEIMIRRDAQKIAGHILTEVEYLALEDWETDILNRWDAAKEQYKELDGKDEKTQAEAVLFAELSVFKDQAEGVRKVLAQRKKKHRGHAESSGNSGRMTNMLLEAQPALAKSIGELNTDAFQLCVGNGVLQFSVRPDPSVSEHDAAWGAPVERPMVELLPHGRDRLITKIVKADYDPKAPRPVFERFLEQILPDPEIRAHLKRWFGYCLTGDVSEQKLAFLYGGGRNGKSTLVDVLARIMNDYGTTLPIETLTGKEQRKGSEATPDLVRLPGARLVRASEPEQGQKMKEALIKALTGGEGMLIRRMNQEFIEVYPEFKLTISGNYRPEVRGADDGIWRRIMLIPFETQIAAEDVDPLLPKKLWAERDGILAWMVEGCLEWMDKGLQPPAAVNQATEDYRRESGPMRLFFETECEITGFRSDKVSPRDLGDAFNAWLIEIGTSPWGRRQTSNQLVIRVENVKGPSGQTFTWVKITCSSMSASASKRMPSTVSPHILTHFECADDRPQV